MTNGRTTTRKPRPCPVCVHPHRAGIDDALADGEPPEQLSEVHGVTVHALRVHRKRHLDEEHTSRLHLYRESLNWTMKQQSDLEAMMRRADAQLARIDPDRARTARNIMESLEADGRLERMREAARMNETRRQVALSRDHAKTVQARPPADTTLQRSKTKNASAPPPAHTGRCERSHPKSAGTPARAGEE